MEKEVGYQQSNPNDETEKGYKVNYSKLPKSFRPELLKVCYGSDGKEGYKEEN
jgi:hypothetical protein